MSSSPVPPASFSSSPSQKKQTTPIQNTLQKIKASIQHLRDFSRETRDVGKKLWPNADREARNKMFEELRMKLDYLEKNDKYLKSVSALKYDDSYLETEVDKIMWQIAILKENIERSDRTYDEEVLEKNTSLRNFKVIVEKAAKEPFLAKIMSDSMEEHHNVTDMVQDRWEELMRLVADLDSRVGSLFDEVQEKTSIPVKEYVDSSLQTIRDTLISKLNELEDHSDSVLTGLKISEEEKAEEVDRWLTEMAVFEAAFDEELEGQEKVRKELGAAQKKVKELRTSQDKLGVALDESQRSYQIAKENGIQQKIEYENVLKLKIEAMTKLEAENAILVAERDMYTTLKEEHKQLSTKYQGLKNTNDELIAKHETLESDHSELEDKINNTETRFSSLGIVLGYTILAKQEVETQLKAAELAGAQHMAETETQHMARVEGLRADLATANHNLEDLQHSKEELEHTNEGLQQKNVELNEDIKAYRNRLSTGHEQVAEPREFAESLRQKMLDIPHKFRDYCQDFLFARSIVIAEMPYSILCAIGFFLPLYYIPGLQMASDRDGYQFLMVLLVELFSVTLGQIISALTPSTFIAMLLSPPIMIVFTLFCGVTVPKPQIPGFWRAWLYKLDPFTRLIGGMVVTELQDLDVVCRPQELNRFTAPSGQACGEYMAPYFANRGLGYIADNMTSACEYCAYRVGEQFYENLGLSFDNRWRDLGIMAVFIECVKSDPPFAWVTIPEIQQAVDRAIFVRTMNENTQERRQLAALRAQYRNLLDYLGE